MDKLNSLWQRLWRADDAAMALAPAPAAVTFMPFDHPGRLNGQKDILDHWRQRRERMALIRGDITPLAHWQADDGALLGVGALTLVIKPAGGAPPETRELTFAAAAIKARQGLRLIHVMEASPAMFTEVVRYYEDAARKGPAA